MDTDLNQPFSWVRERANCSPVVIYERLRLQVREDVEQRKDLRTASEREFVNFNMMSNGKEFTVIRLEHGSDKSITFRCEEKKIIVTDSKDKVMLDATLTLGDDGQCRLNTQFGDGMRKICDLWQFRRAALEGLFFGLPFLTALLAFSFLLS